MRRLRYSVASSLDGFIAGPKGEYDWIPADPDIDFGALFAQFDTLVMGRKTYQATPPEHRIPGMATYVASRTLRQQDHPDVTIVSGGLAETVNRLKSEPGKDIWLFGGGSLFAGMAAEGLVDEVEVAVVPILLGQGVPLTQTLASSLELELREHRLYEKSGIMLLTYAVR